MRVKFHGEYNSERILKIGQHYFVKIVSYMFLTHSVA